MPDVDAAVAVFEELVAAENAAGNQKARDRAEPHLHPEFRFTRARGVELTKDDYLADLLKAADGKREPSVDSKYASKEMAALRGIVLLKGKRYRNQLVFLADGDKWLCVFWQVTDLDPNMKPTS